MVDRNYLIKLTDEIEYNTLILLHVIPNDSELSLEQLKQTNLKMKQHLEFILQVI